MKRTAKLYQCYSCLRESADPLNCTNCGAPIEELDLTNAMFIPPIGGMLWWKALIRKLLRGLGVLRVG